MRGSARCRGTADRPAPGRYVRLTSSQAKAVKRGRAWRLRRGAGSRLNSDAEIIESGEYPKNDNCLPSTRSESGKPICAIARDPPPRPARQFVVAAETLC